MANYTVTEIDTHVKASNSHTQIVYLSRDNLDLVCEARGNKCFEFTLNYHDRREASSWTLKKTEDRSWGATGGKHIMSTGGRLNFDLL